MSETERALMNCVDLLNDIYGAVLCRQGALNLFEDQTNGFDRQMIILMHKKNALFAQYGLGKPKLIRENATTNSEKTDPPKKKRGRPFGSYCDYSKSKWHKDGYLTISEYAEECGIHPVEVETAIRRKILTIEKIDGVRYIPESMPRYSVKRINGCLHRYTFVLQPNLKEHKEE